MAAALLGYFTTMVAALAVCMVLLNGALTSSLLQRPKLQPYPAPVVAENVQGQRRTAESAPAVADDGRSVAKNTERSEFRHAQKRKAVALERRKDLARQYEAARQQQPGAVALNYNQESVAPSATPSIFNLFARRVQ